MQISEMAGVGPDGGGRTNEQIGTIPYGRTFQDSHIVSDDPSSGSIHGCNPTYTLGMSPNCSATPSSSTSHTASNIRNSIDAGPITAPSSSSYHSTLAPPAQGDPRHGSVEPGSQESPISPNSQRAHDVLDAGDAELRRQLSQISDTEDDEKTAKYKVWCKNVVDNLYVTLLTTCLTIFALFGKDIFLYSFSKEADAAFNWITVVCLLVFTVEIVLMMLGQPEYLFGFFFWLDLISTASLVLDITLVAELFSGSSTTDESSTLRASRAGRAGSKAGRVVRIFRLIRLIRIAKLYKSYQQVTGSKPAPGLPAPLKRTGSITALDKVGGGGGSSGGESNHVSDAGTGFQRGQSFGISSVRALRNSITSGDEESQGTRIPNSEIHHEPVTGGLDLEIANAQEQEEALAIDKETRVGKKLSDLTTRRVIILVLIMLFLVPYFLPESSMTETTESPQFGLDTLDWLWMMNSDCYDHAVMSFLYYHKSLAATALVTQKWNVYQDHVVFVKLPREIRPNALCGANFTFATHSLSWVDGPYTGGHGGMSHNNQPYPSDKEFQNWVKDVRHSSIDDESPSSRLPTGLPFSHWPGHGGSRRRLEQMPSSLHADGLVFWNFTDVVSQEVLDRLTLEAVRYEDLHDDKGIIFDDDLTSLDDLRGNEKQNVTSVFHELVMDRREFTKFEALLSIIQTLFVVMVLLFFSLQFSRDANNLVLHPIEKMIDRISVIRINPLEAIRLQEELLWREVNKRLQSQDGGGLLDATMGLKLSGAYSCLKNCKHGTRQVKAKEEPMETMILEQTIVKIGTLMALGFGEAGTNIIAQNLESGEEVNPMIPGRKVNAIFGFCDIRNFTDATEILREKVMVFVNQIAGIVHGVVDDYSGSANKNIGDAFLMVWKFPDTHPYTGRPVPYRITDGNTKEVAHLSTINKTADMSLVSYLKIIAMMAKSPVINEYRHHEGLRARMGAAYRVQMGFGLHTGWAIEGAIGSLYKIDASYLSPNVNMSSRLEAATKQFGVPILLSGALVNILSTNIQDEVRQIDCVTVKGSNEPMDLYTVDVLPDNVPVDNRQKEPAPTGGKNERTNAMQALKMLTAKKMKRAFKKQLWNPDFDMSSFFRTDPDIRLMRKHIPPNFLADFRVAFRLYSSGQWSDCRRMLLR
eukprot:GHVQ01009452.1.p1 GENE.GHVQ01009452.1~~GHVQ01009452.1.p1  ORF type:complete len:1149 (-),score=136.56 GHVQ01009452.1:121-3567(-)